MLRSDTLQNHSILIMFFKYHFFSIGCTLFPTLIANSMSLSMMVMRLACSAHSCVSTKSSIR